MTPEVRYLSITILLLAYHILRLLHLLASGIKLGVRSAEHRDLNRRI
jgi:hypothetical protein